MFRQPPPHTKAEREKFFGLTTEITDLPQEEVKLLQNVNNVLTLFGRPLADKVKVEKYQGPNIQKVDEYTAVRRGPNQT